MTDERAMGILLWRDNPTLEEIEEMCAVAVAAEPQYLGLTLAAIITNVILDNPKSTVEGCSQYVASPSFAKFYKKFGKLLAPKVKS